MNRQKQLENCLNSIINSNYKIIELIIIDNGSNDNTADYLSRLTNENIKTIFNNQNLGLAHARNQGISASKGEYILFVDDDNVIDKSMITTLLQFFKEHKMAGIVTPKTLYKDNPKKIWFYGANINMYTSKAKFFYSNVIDNEDSVNHEIKINCVHNCFMVRKDLFDKVGIFDNKLFVSYTEFDLCMKAKKHYEIYVCGNAKCYHDRLTTDRKNTVESFGFTNPYRVYYLIRNRGVIAKKYASLFQLMIFSGLYYPLFFFYYGIILIKFNRLDYLKYHVKGFLAGVIYIIKKNWYFLNLGVEDYLPPIKHKGT